MFRAALGTVIAACLSFQTGSVDAASGSPAPTLTFTLNPKSIVLGSSAGLRWFTSNANSCNATGGSWSGSLPVRGSQTVMPGAVGIYRYPISCSGLGGSVASSAILQVTSAPYAQPSIGSFAPTFGPVGTIVTMTGSGFTGLTKVQIGNVSDATFTVVSDTQVKVTVPADAQSGAHGVTVSNPQKVSSSPNSFTVTTAAEAVTLTANPTSITLGNSATLNWSSSNVSSCTASGAWSGSFATTGNWNVTPTATGTPQYTLTCTGAGGSVASVTNLTVTSTTGGDVAPSAVANLQLINQGGPSNAVNPLSNYQEFSWAAATAGTYPVSSYKIYRNGAAYDTTTNMSYADTNATDSNIVDLSGPTTTYAYTVSAVDTHGNEGSQAQASAYLFYGQLFTPGDLNYSGVTTAYTDTGGSPVNGPYDMLVTYNFGGGFQPISGPPIAQGANGFGNDLEVGAFNYMVMDIKVTDNHYLTNALNTSLVTRLPPGDVFSYKKINVWDYATPIIGSWVTFKIPLTDLNVGTGTFTGSIGICSGTAPNASCTLTVSAILSVASVDAGGMITGSGVPAGTYLFAHGQNSSVGTFTIQGPNLTSSTNVSSETMNYRRTGFYKSFFQWGSDNSTTIYVNNLGFTTN